MDIKDLRLEVDSIDKELVSLMVKRFKITDKMALYKKERNLPVRDEKREKEIIEEVKALAGKDFEKEAEELFVFIFSRSRKRQQQLINEK